MLAITFTDLSSSGAVSKSNRFNISRMKRAAGLLCRNTAVTSTVTDDLSTAIETSHLFSRTNITAITSELPVLKNADNMFSWGALTLFNTPLDTLENGHYMFAGCDLTSFNIDLPLLTNGQAMFYDNSKLTSFNAQLPLLENGRSMFSNCPLLTSFNINTPKLLNGYTMFSGCTSLTDFNGDLSSLTNGYQMFSKCKLTPTSVQNIISTLNTPETNADFCLGINVTNDSATVNAQLLAFAQAVGYNSWAELKQVFTDKNWTTLWRYSGTTTNIALSEDEEFRGTPIYAQIIEEEDPENAEYCTEDGSTYYNINWGHDVSDYTQFQYFGSLLEACGYWGVIPKIYLEQQ